MLPLRITNTEGHDGPVYTITTAQGNFYAKTYSLTDAQLIAAGPEMLEALKDILRVNKESFVQLASVERIAKAALALAQGGK